MNKDSDGYRQPLYRRRQLHFTCTQCGCCCRGSADYQVFLDASRAEKIRVYLDLSPSWFRRRYLTRDENTLILQSRDDGRCILLGKDDRCRAYAVRPAQCATYPFWPELVKTARAWRQERVRCEGIDCGDAVPVSFIEAALRRCHEEEEG
jgi:Fe-S-cluster containining protein